MLPTLNSMQARHPDLYTGCVCCLCETEDEDNHHLWTCSAAATTTTAIWRDAIAKIDDWGARATNRYNAARKKEHEQAVARGRAVPRPVPVRWRYPSNEDHVRGVSSIGGALAVHLGQPAPDRLLEPRWSVSDLLRGITPKSLLEAWIPVFGVPRAIAQTVIHKFVGYLEAQASERIWKARCSATIDWEKEQGITAKGKKTPYSGVRGDWSQGYGYITPEGYCPCGATLATHDDGRCPGPSVDPHAADACLLESLLGKRRLTVMERMGTVPFIRI